MVKRRVSLLVCCSTQRLAAQISEYAPEGLLITSEYQAKGRGQAHRSWEADVAQNLLLTLLLRPTFLSTDRAFLLSMVAALALYDLLDPLGLPGLAIKWPNDIFADGKKLAGTLIDTKIQSGELRSALLGVGLNVNQRHFKTPRATSLALLLGRSYDRAKLLNDWEDCLSARYELLRHTSSHEDLCTDYQKSLLNLGQIVSYQVPGRRPFSALLRGVDLRGCLCLENEQGTQYFLPGSITYLGHN